MDLGILIIGTAHSVEPPSSYDVVVPMVFSCYDYMGMGEYLNSLSVGELKPIGWDETSYDIL